MIEYPIILEDSIKTSAGEIVQARAFQGAEGWELWGQIPNGGEVHLKTRYFWESPEMPIEWQVPECGYNCGWTEPYGFVPEAGCPVHDIEQPEKK